MDCREFGKRQCARAELIALFANARLIKRIYNHQAIEQEYTSTLPSTLKRAWKEEEEERLRTTCPALFVLSINLDVVRRTDQASIGVQPCHCP